MSQTESNREHIRQVIITVMKLLHYTVTCGIFYVFWILFRYGSFSEASEIGFRYNYFVLLGYGAILFFFNRTYNSYLLGYNRIRTVAFSEFLAQLLTLFITYAGVSVAWNRLYNPLWFIPMLFCQAILDILWSYYGNLIYFKLYPTKKTILIYRNELDKQRFGSIKGKPTERLYRIEEEFEYKGNSFREIRDRLEGYEAVFVAGVNARCRNGIAKYCKEMNITGFFLPHVGDVIMQEATHIQSFDSPVMYLTRTHLRPEYLFIKRAFDIVSSLLAIIILSPIMLITALAIKLYDGGPALYNQVRLTKDGKTFKIWKFRSMRVDAEKDGIARLSTGDNDDRITPIGKIVRKCRLDELPQLFNILFGQMSIVGPRPERPEIAEQYYEHIPDFKLRLQVKAGLTGYAQVYGKYNIDPYEKLQFDLLYINNMNVLTDLRLIFATIGILFLPESTEGVAVGATTAMDYENAADSTENDAERLVNRTD